MTDILSQLTNIDPTNLDAIKQFLKDNYKNMPEDLQKEVLLGFFIDAAEKDPVQTIQIQADDALRELSALKKALAAA